MVPLDLKFILCFQFLLAFLLYLLEQLVSIAEEHAHLQEAILILAFYPVDSFLAETDNWLNLGETVLDIPHALLEDGPVTGHLLGDWGYLVRFVLAPDYAIEAQQFIILLAVGFQLFVVHATDGFLLEQADEGGIDGVLVEADPIADLPTLGATQLPRLKTFLNAPLA